MAKPCFKSVKKSRKPKGYILDNQISFIFIRRILFLLPLFSRYASKQSQWAILIAEYISQILSAETSSTESKSLQLIIPSCKLDDKYDKKAILFLSILCQIMHVLCKFAKFLHFV